MVTYMSGPIDQPVYEILLTQTQREEFQNLVARCKIPMIDVHQVYPRILDTGCLHVDYTDGTHKLFVLRGDLPQWWGWPIPG